MKKTISLVILFVFVVMFLFGCSGETETIATTTKTPTTVTNEARDVYNNAWSKTKALTNYNVAFSWEVSGSTLGFSGGFSYKGNAKVRDGEHSGYIESETSGNPKKTYIYSAPHNDIYSIESHLTSESDNTTRAIAIVFSGFSNGLIVELPQSAQSRLTYSNGVLRGDLTESETKSVYAHMFSVVEQLSNKEIKSSSIKVNSADLEITVDSSNTIKEYKMTLKGKSGTKSFTSVIDVVISG